VQPTPSARSPAFVLVGRLALAAAFAVWAALLAGALAPQFWLLELLSHFRVQYAALLLALALALFATDQRRFAIACVLGSALGLGSVVAYTGWQSQLTRASSNGFRLVTFNVWFRNEDFARVAQYLESTRADAIVLQELTAAEARELGEQLPSYRYSYLGAARPQGAAVFSRWPIVAAAGVDFGTGARGARVELQWRDTAVTLLGVHLHWPLGSHNSHKRNSELAQIAAFARSIDGPLLIGGDFNVTPWSAHFRRVVAESGLADCAAGRGLLPTWPAQFAPMRIRIDQCLASKQWNVVDIRTGPSIGSDHLPTVTDLSL
jgi:endonuclease/exonuclease/phosphatase (EEP) superfamily protein YafD